MEWLDFIETSLGSLLVTNFLIKFCIQPSPLFLFFTSGTFEGKRERQNYRDLVNDPQLKFSGLYQRYVLCFYSDYEVFIFEVVI